MDNTNTPFEPPDDIIFKKYLILDLEKDSVQNLLLVFKQIKDVIQVYILHERLGLVEVEDYRIQHLLVKFRGIKDATELRSIEQHYKLVQQLIGVGQAGKAYIEVDDRNDKEPS